MRWSWLHARWHVNRQDRKAKGVPNGRASIYVGRDDLGRGSYNRRGGTRSDRARLGGRMNWLLVVGNSML